MTIPGQSDLGIFVTDSEMENRANIKKLKPTDVSNNFSLHHMKTKS